MSQDTKIRQFNSGKNNVIYLHQLLQLPRQITLSSALHNAQHNALTDRDSCNARSNDKRPLITLVTVALVKGIVGEHVFVVDPASQDIHRCRTYCLPHWID